MKLQVFMISFVLVYAAEAKVVENGSEEFECIANYLQAKRLLHINFKYYVQSEPLDCDPFLNEIREMCLNNPLKVALEDESSDEDEGAEDLAEIKQLYKQNPACVHDQLLTLNYTDILMQMYVYQKSVKLSKRLKRKYVAALENERVKKLTIASSICFPDAFHGNIFDQIFTKGENEDESLEDKQIDYCIVKYVTENKLVDTTEHQIALNPHNIDTDFDCTDHIDDIIDAWEEVIAKRINADSVQPRRQVRCMSRAMKNKNSAQYMIKITVLSEVTLSDEQKAKYRTEFVEFMKQLYAEFYECI